MGEPLKSLEFPRPGTLDDYFKLASDSLEKLEFRGSRTFPLRGEIVAMAGGTEYHSLIMNNVGGEVRSRLRGKPCRFYTSEFGIGIRDYPTYTYCDGHDPSEPVNSSEEVPDRN